MKKKSVVGKILQSVWSAISSIWKKTNEKVKQFAPVAIEVVEELKLWIESPIGDLITQIIPGTIDDKLRAQLLKVLPVVISKLQLSIAITGITDPNEQLRAILAQLKFASDAQKDSFYHEFGYLIIELLADGDLSRSDSILITEFYLKHIRKPAA